MELGIAIESKPSCRPRGRTIGASHCNLPDIDYSVVRKEVAKYLGEKAFASPIVQKLVKNVYKLVYSHKVTSYHSYYYSHRKKFSIERDIAGWIVLIATLNFGLSMYNGEYFKSPNTLTRLNQLCGFESLSRAHRFISFYEKIGLILPIKKQSKKNYNLKYLEFYIHRDALKLLGISDTEILKEVKRAEKRFEANLKRPGTKEFEFINSIAQELDKTLPQLPLPFEYRTGEAGRVYEAKERLYWFKKKYPSKTPIERLLMLRASFPKLFEAVIPP